MNTTDADKFYRAAYYAWKRWRSTWGNIIDKDDAVQEAVLACWRRAHQFDPNRSSDITFFTVVARSAMVEMVRAAATQKRTMPGHQYPLAAAGASTQPGPLDLAILNEEIDQVVDALDDLPSRQGEAARRYFGLNIRGGSMQEVADAMGVTRQMVSIHVRNSLLFLRNDPRFSERVSHDEMIELV